MTVTIQLSDEQAALLQARAAQEGLSIDAWLQRVAAQYAQEQERVSQGGTDRPVWEIVADRIAGVPSDVLEKLPADGASEHDHYLYGLPKHNS